MDSALRKRDNSDSDGHDEQRQRGPRRKKQRGGSGVKHYCLHCNAAGHKWSFCGQECIHCRTRSHSASFIPGRPPVGDANFCPVLLAMRPGDYSKEDKAVKNLVKGVTQGAEKETGHQGDEAAEAEQPSEDLIKEKNDEIATLKIQLAKALESRDAAYKLADKRQKIIDHLKSTMAVGEVAEGSDGGKEAAREEDHGQQQPAENSITATTTDHSQPADGGRDDGR